MGKHAHDDPSWMRSLAGRFIVFDGPDGSGKSTQFHALVSLVREAGIAVCDVREPGGTQIGERIRDILLDPALTDMDVRTEMLLYMASRAQLVRTRIAPALARGEFVLADRFVSSTLAYQGAAGGLDAADIMHVAQVACGPHAPRGDGAWPDLTVIFDVDEQTASTRMNPLLDRMEKKGAEFHRLVRNGFLSRAEAEPERYAVIDASRPADTVTTAVLDLLRERFGARTPAPDARR